MSLAPTEEEWSWVGADGHLRSGSRDELMRWYREGKLPAQNPVKKSDWTDWISVGELVAPPTEPYNAIPSFEDTHSTHKQRTLVMRADSTASDDITVPRGIPALSPASAQQIIEIIPVPVPAPQQFTPPTPPPLPPLPLPPPSVAPPASRSGLLIVAGGLLFVAIAIVAVAAVFLFRNRPAAKATPKPVAPTPVASTPPPAPHEPLPSVCRANGERVRLLSIVPPGATPSVATRNDRLVFGIPVSERGGVGVTVDPKTLALIETTPFADATRVAGIVPSGAGFSIDRFATRVPGSDFSLGMTPNGLSRLGDDASQSVVWEGDAALPITRPAMTHVPGRGYAVAFRRGDFDVRAGWIDEHGAKKADLVRLTSEAVKASSPAIASSGERVVVAFSAVDADSKSRVVLADLSPKLRTLPTTGENPRAPALESLGKERFVVGWLEGDAVSGRSLHVRVVDSDLAPVGSDETVASFTRPVESITLWQHGGRPIMLLAERAAESRNELFALRLDCH